MDEEEYPLNDLNNFHKTASTKEDDIIDRIENVKAFN